MKMINQFPRNTKVCYTDDLGNEEHVYIDFYGHGKSSDMVVVSPMPVDDISNMYRFVVTRDHIHEIWTDTRYEDGLEDIPKHVVDSWKQDANAYLRDSFSSAMGTARLAFLYGRAFEYRRNKKVERPL